MTKITFHRETAGQWMGNGFGTQAATHIAKVDGEVRYRLWSSGTRWIATKLDGSNRNIRADYLKDLRAKVIADASK